MKIETGVFPTPLLLCSPDGVGGPSSTHLSAQLRPHSTTFNPTSDSDYHLRALIGRYSINGPCFSQQLVAIQINPQINTLSWNRQ